MMLRYEIGFNLSETALSFAKNIFASLPIGNRKASFKMTLK